ncbi:MAG TPA: hypothetical protein VI386_12750 [Candidatus Sulfotelmatobacter sp.]
MRWFACLFCTFCLSSALEQAVISVPLVDRTVGENPLEARGGGLLRELARANELEWSWGERVTVKNLSGNPILLYVVSITEVGRHVPPAGRHSAPGNGSIYRLEDDMFFSEKLFGPGESLVLRETMPGTPIVDCCINPLAKLRDPSVEYRLLFVQFADGSTFGDPAEAQDVLSMRQRIVNDLLKLRQSYGDRGVSGFTDTLNERSAFSVTSVYKQILSKFTDEGVLAAVGEAERIIAIAERHAGEITGASSTRKPSR